MSPNQTHTINAGEGHSSPGVDQAMQEAKNVEVSGVNATKDGKVGGIIDAGASIGEVLQKGSMGIGNAIARTLMNISAMVLVGAILVYQIVVKDPENQQLLREVQMNFHGELQADRTSHERQQDKDRAMYREERESDRENMRSIVDSLPREVAKAVKEAITGAKQ